MGDEPKISILLVEDEKNLAFNLVLNLEAEGYHVMHVDSGPKAIQALLKHQEKACYRLCILDVMIPVPDGFKVAETLREFDSKTPIIMLTARASDEDRLHGLGIGVDDYLTKPFHLGELLLRVKRSLERLDMMEHSPPDGVHESLPKEKIITLDIPQKISIQNHQLVAPDRTPVPLTELEENMFVQFALHPDTVLSREHLLEKVWGVSGQISTRTVDNFVVRLRRYLEKISQSGESTIWIDSVRGRGYRFTGTGPDPKNS